MTELDQVAIAVVVLATAALFLRNLFASSTISPGFDVDHTVRAEVNLPAATYRTPDQIRTYVDRTVPELQALPGIETGIVGNSKTTTIGEEDQPQLYEPLAQIQNDRRRLQFVLRAITPSALQIEPVRHVLRRAEPAAGTEVATLYSSIGLLALLLATPSSSWLSGSASGLWRRSS